MRDSVVDCSGFDIDLRFECPRCGQATVARFFGPCPGCAAALRAEMVGEDDRVVTPAEYVPKTNVTPNAVALRDD